MSRMSMKRTGVGGALLAVGVLCAVSAASAAATVAPYLASALADPGRGDMAATDARRHPGAIIALSDAKPGDTVVDLIPGGGYFTRILSKVVGPQGHVYMIWPNEYAKEAQSDLDGDKQLATEPAYRNVSVLQQPAAAFSTPAPVDVVLTVQNYHDYPDKFMGRVDPVVLDRQVYRALKPGGVFLIVDHVADAGSGLRDTDTRHRIDPAIVKAEVASVGFRFDGESDVLRNPADDHQRTVFDPAIRGHTDQFIYRFRKPG